MNFGFRLYFILCIAVFSSVPVKGQDEKQSPLPDKQMVAWLDSMPYFFGAYYRGDSICQPVWQHGRGKQGLVVITRDSLLSFKARFLAAEILFENDSLYPSDTDRVMLGKLYAAALKGGNAGDADDWGMPFGGEDEFGYIGPHVIRIGKAAVLPFASLLKDKTPMKYMINGKFTDTRYKYGIRVNDFAAFYISHIMGWHYRCLRSRFLRDFRIRHIERKVKRIH
ncbi:MAG TPA: hypothetical protein VFU15_06515 [Bacteroidia bacterium]|nr:hypothetical protein [Bacteroidia bacterium]